MTGAVHLGSILCIDHHAPRVPVLPLPLSGALRVLLSPRGVLKLDALSLLLWPWLHLLCRRSSCRLTLRHLSLDCPTRRWGEGLLIRLSRGVLQEGADRRLPHGGLREAALWRVL